MSYIYIGIYMWYLILLVLPMATVAAGLFK